MILFVAIGPRSLEVRLPSPKDVRADYRRELVPGDRFAGYSYVELRRLGDGRHTLPDRPVASRR